MPHVTGSAPSFAALLSALQTACTNNGWTLSGNVLQKGTCFVEAYVGTPIATGAAENGTIFVRAGNGIDGGNALTDPAPRHSTIGRLRGATGNSQPDWTWPVTYDIHVHEDPDEVWLAVNYNGVYWQHMAFGQSPVVGNAGTGNWHFASVRQALSAAQSPRIGECVISPGGPNSVWSTHFCPAPFLIAEMGTNGSQNALMHGAIHSVSGDPIWSDGAQAFASGTAEGRVSALSPMLPLLSRSPNSWNNEPVLLPLQVLQRRPSNKASIIGELRHSRMCRNDFISAGDILQLGPDRWKVYPCYRKNAEVRNGLSDGFSGGIDHSGTVAVAVRYDGG